ncbi:hypothetical protein Fot_22008 [Forsythia ovata]|uniref:Uncharacterized protein n=1 Tax=Forsythia ovata TaxID=205694 RepID=A0ABD1UWG9_9LAMI
MCGICSRDCRPPGIGGNGEQLSISSVGTGNNIGGASVPLLTGPVSPMENFIRSRKMKAVVGCQGETVVPWGTWRTRRILRGLGGATRILLQGSRIVFSMIEERPEPLFLILLVSPNILTLGHDRTNWTQPLGKIADSGRHYNSFNS